MSDRSRSPFERLREYYEHEERVCPECGFEDEEGAWEAEADGADVVYTHTCSECGAERRHSLELPDRETALEHVERRQ
ncbi:HVO_0649 family zinc finger protein [Halorubrum sp. RMP-47]|uniref:HVO_0649 family zinc finger protein n=1 Tax=Halorubrum miltondacostae TaxID=3076378 RepID=A0ABD5M004_9EURY